jgi:hypothetical protein
MSAERINRASERMDAIVNAQALRAKTEARLEVRLTVELGRAYRDGSRWEVIEEIEYCRIPWSEIYYDGSGPLWSLAQYLYDEDYRPATRGDSRPTTYHRELKETDEHDGTAAYWAEIDEDHDAVELSVIELKGFSDRELEWVAMFVAHLHDQSGF